MNCPLLRVQPPHLHVQWSTQRKELRFFPSEPALLWGRSPVIQHTPFNVLVTWLPPGTMTTVPLSHQALVSRNEMQREEPRNQQAENLTRKKMEEEKPPSFFPAWDSPQSNPSQHRPHHAEYFSWHQLVPICPISERIHRFRLTHPSLQ